MATYLAGYEGSVTIASADAHITKWELTDRNGLVETTNTGDAGWESYIAGVSGADLTYDAFFDSTNVPSTAIGLVSGASLAHTLKVGTSGLTFTCTALIESVKYTNEVKGGVSFTVTGKVSGALTRPT